MKLFLVLAFVAFIQVSSAENDIKKTLNGFKEQSKDFLDKCVDGLSGTLIKFKDRALNEINNMSTEIDEIEKNAANESAEETKIKAMKVMTQFEDRILEDLIIMKSEAGPKVMNLGKFFNTVRSALESKLPK